MTIWKRWIQGSVLCGLLLGGLVGCAGMMAHPSVGQIASDDHAALAAWYDTEAAQLRQSAKDEMAMAEAYRKSPGTMDPGLVTKRPNRMGNMAQHYEIHAAMYTKAAEEAEQLAQDHRDMLK
jgi:gas vesicle protein